MAGAAYRRTLLKVSGEALMGDAPYGIDTATVARIAQQIQAAQREGAEIAVVVGGGNIFRGSEAEAAGMDRATADYAGMLATVINALALQDALEKLGATVRTQTAIIVQQVAEPYIRRRAIRHLEKGRVVIFAGGTGNPYFSTDTAAVLRALEIEADVLVKATSVDGVYSADPKQDPAAEFIPELTFQDAIVRGLAVMDANAFGLCKENGLPIVVMNVNQPGAIARVLQGERVGTLVR